MVAKIKILYSRLNVQVKAFFIRTGVTNRYYYVKERIIRCAILFRLKHKQLIKANEIYNRWSKHKNYLDWKEIREREIELSYTIAKFSDESGMPQWEIRAQLDKLVGK